MAPNKSSSAFCVLFALSSAVTASSAHAQRSPASVHCQLRVGSCGVTIFNPHTDRNRLRTIERCRLENGSVIDLRFDMMTSRTMQFTSSDIRYAPRGIVIGQCRGRFDQPAPDMAAPRIEFLSLYQPIEGTVRDPALREAIERAQRACNNITVSCERVDSNSDAAVADPSRTAVRDASSATPTETSSPAPSQSSAPSAQ